MQLPLLDNRLWFPEIKDALTEPNGILAIGGDLSVERLLLAYQNGIFPWFSEGEPIIWWSPDPRAVMVAQDFHVSRSFRQFLNRQLTEGANYRITINYDFESVITACSLSHGETWITDAIITAYCKLHQLGFAHSVEVWQNRQLVGGLYGVAQGAMFCGESMFSHQTNASKMALYFFCKHFIQCGGEMVDCQVINPHTASLGAIEIARHDYLTKLKQLQKQKITTNCWLKQELN